MKNNEPNTNNFLNWVDIKNFKSIKDLHLDCKRVNVFIGKPNVGKSNILEGLGLLGAGWHGDDKYLVGAVRYKKIKDLFFDLDDKSKIQIVTKSIHLIIEKREFLKQEGNNYNLIWRTDKLSGEIFYLEEGGVVESIRKPVTSVEGPVMIYPSDIETIILDSVSSPVKKYDFVNLTEFENSFSQFLLPPSGPNLYEVVRRNKKLWEEFAKLFIEQQLDLVLYDEKQKFILQKKDGPYVWQYPFFSIADTFRRFMFYITAIESNKNSVIIFEEPEVHSFPPYTQEMAYRMIYDEDNQYFISTHSPYMLHPFIEKMDYKDLNVFITYYKDYQTYVRALTEEELTDILDYSTNVFFNLNKFEPNA